MAKQRATLFYSIKESDIDKVLELGSKQKQARDDVVSQGYHCTVDLFERGFDAYPTFFARIEEERIEDLKKAIKNYSQIAGTPNGIEAMTTENIKKMIDEL